MDKISAADTRYGSFVDVLRNRADEHPQRLLYQFLVDGERPGRSLTYGEFDRSARTIAAFLQGHAMAEKCALLLYPQGLEFLEALFGCLYSKVIAVPAYSPHPAFLKRSLPRLQAIVKETGATIGLTTTETLPPLLSLMGDFPELRQIKWLSTDNLGASEADNWRETSVGKDTVAFIQYTSGSTTDPKGVILTHGNLLHQACADQERLGWEEQLIMVSWLPVFHDMGLIGNVVGPLYVGGQTVLMSSLAFLQKPCRWLRAISKYRAACSSAPNFAYQLCVDHITDDQRQGLDLSSWELAVCGAEPIRVETIDNFTRTYHPFGFRRESFFPCYGLAEATLMVSGGPKEEPPIARYFKSTALRNHEVSEADGQDQANCLVACGEPVSDQKTIIVDPESLKKCPKTKVGEIWISGPSVSLGYWNRPKDTEATFQAILRDTGEGPFLRTGDLGFISGGQLFIAGRLKDIIIIRGKNHYPQDIEFTAQHSHTSIRLGCVAAFSLNVAGEERLVVAAEVERRHFERRKDSGGPPNTDDRRSSELRRDDPGTIPHKTGAPVDPDAAIAAIRQAVAQDHGLEIYSIALLRAGAIPKTSSGKIQRGLCRKKLLEGSLETIGQWHLNKPQSLC